MVKAKKIFFLTGARSEYDILYPLIKRCQKSDLTVGTIVTATHLSPFHGLGINQIKDDGIPVVAEVETLISSESWQGRSLSFANLLEGLTRFLSSNRPDLLVIAGDREEALAGALVCNFLKIHVAHLFGGDRVIASDIDEVFRPAITKLSHFHFTANDNHTKRIIKMGELPELVWTCGATGLDNLKEISVVEDGVLNQKYNIDVKKPFFILIQHPSSTLSETKSGEEMDIILNSVLSFNIPVFCSYPNSDPGNIAIRNVIDFKAKKNKNLIKYHNLPREDFISLYKKCSAIIGNSSSIVIESPFLGVPGILVGPRQDYRELAGNTIRVNISSKEIKYACKKVLENKEFIERAKNCKSPYGQGDASQKIFEIIDHIQLDDKYLLKTIAY